MQLARHRKRRAARTMGGIAMGALLFAAAPALGQQTAPLVPAQDPTRQVAPLPSLADLLDETVPAVVSISVRTEAVTESPLYQDPFFRRFFGGPRQPEPAPQPRARVSAGSGVIVDAAEGLVLTNSHVIAGGQEINVTLGDGRTYQAELVGRDAATDIAVLRIEADNLTQLEFRDSAELRVGDYVVAIGNPFGLGQTVTSGIVSALGRTGLNLEGYEDFIQTDASINPGNSGGALVTLDGRLVGINTAIISPRGAGNIGIGFAVPSNMAEAVMDQLVEFGEVRRGQLGVSIQNVTPDVAQALEVPQPQGALVGSVAPGTAAEQAGLLPGDVILAIDGEPVVSSAALRNTIGLTPVGETLELRIWREGSEQTVSVTIGEPEVLTAAAPADGRLEGATFADPGPGQPDGAMVAEVQPGSAAEAAGLQPGDVIAGVNRQQVASADQLVDILESIEGTLALRLQREGRSAIVIIR